MVRRLSSEKIASQIGGLSAEDAKNYVEVLQSQDRYVEDVLKNILYYICVLRRVAFLYFISGLCSRLIVK